MKSFLGTIVLSACFPLLVRVPSSEGKAAAVLDPATAMLDKTGSGGWPATPSEK